MEPERYDFRGHVGGNTDREGLGQFGSYITTLINGATCERLRTLFYLHSYIFLSSVFSSQFIYLR